MADLDGDGDLDLLSGSYPGEIYQFDRLADGTFAPMREVLDRWGNKVNVGRASAPNVIDWDRDGDLDLLIGDIQGEVWFVPNGSAEGSQSMLLGEPVNLDIFKGLFPSGSVAIGNDAGPCVADWDGDGNHDLLVGGGNGCVKYFRNLSSSGMPRLAPPVDLVPADASPREFTTRKAPGAGLGRRAKVDVADWNGDGLDDLIMGVFSDVGVFPEELTEAQREEWESAQRAYTEALEALAVMQEEEKASVLERMGIPKGQVLSSALKREVDRVANTRTATRPDFAEAVMRLGDSNRVLNRYKPSSTYHGWVWVFVRKP